MRLNHVPSTCHWADQARLDKETSWSRSIARMLSSIKLSATCRNAVSHRGWTPLMVCCASAFANVRSVRALLVDGADVERRTVQGYTALSAAVHARAPLSVIEELLSWGADPNVCTKEGGFPLLFAAFHKRRDVMERLFSSGARVNVCSCDGYTPLLVSCLVRSDASTVRLLLNAGADVHARDRQQWTALMIAVGMHAPLAVVYLLLEYGSDLMASDDEGYTPLSLARDGNSPHEVVELLQGWKG